MTSRSLQILELPVIRPDLARLILFMVNSTRSCLTIILRDLSRLFRHDLSRYSSKICSDLACKILQGHESYCFKILQEFFLGITAILEHVVVVKFEYSTDTVRAG